MSLRTLFSALALWCITAIALASGPGFRSEALFAEHYAKHGSEFGNISKLEYLRRAQELRDAHPGGPILQAVKGDIITRYDQRRGYFGAYNRNGTIRTFFIPAAGESYFRRQARR